MSVTTTFYGYLEAAYMLAPYLSDFATAAIPMQLDRRIVVESVVVRTQQDRVAAGSFYLREQLNRRIDSGSSDTLSQIDQRIDSGSKTVRQQLNRRIVDDFAVNTQLDRQTDGSNTTYTQLDQALTSTKVVRQQLELRLVKDRTVNTQLNRRIDSGSKTTRQEVGRGPISHQTCDGYLTGPYLSEPYLAPFICAHLRQQISHRLVKQTTVYSQLDRRIDSGSKITRQQLNRRIEDTEAINTQLTRINAFIVNSQLLISIYNTTNLRILCDFPSRGTSGTNWTVVAGGTAAGDRGINNVNTDIVEQVYRSTATTVTLQCDTQITQGIFNDTLAILGHNFTTSAIVTLQGSNDVTFSSIPFSETLSVETENMYWISEYLPLNSYRYWRIVVSDTTNTDGYIQIGTIVFGPSIIFNGECFTDEVTRRKTHFADRIRTEGYSAVSNDRALKRALSLRFQKLNYNRENFEKLVGVVDAARTSLKCLWIPTPQYPSRFAVFGKLAEMPVETHKAISRDADYIDMDITVDEAL